MQGVPDHMIVGPAQRLNQSSASISMAEKS
jgi:hypothetical protein